jgi:hypothetical protein
MANYIGERGVKVLDELREYLNSKKAEKQRLVGLIKDVPGSRSFFGYLKYQLIENEEDFNTKKADLIQAVNAQILQMRTIRNESVYKFDDKDADALAYILNDLDSKKTSGFFTKLAQFTPAFIKNNLQPGWKRYVAILALLAFITVMFLSMLSIVGLPILHLGFLAISLISAGFMFGMYRLSKVGENSDEKNLTVYGLNIANQNTSSQQSKKTPGPYTSSAMVEVLGREPATDDATHVASTPPPTTTHVGGASRDADAPPPHHHGPF